jgi:hypothetical protein
VPTYLYVVGAFAIIGLGVAEVLAGAPAATFPPPVVEEPVSGFEALTVLLVLRAFAFGSVALTGTEAISNGVPAFKPPEARNAGATLIAMAVILGVIFVGLSFLASAFGIAPDPAEAETLISQITRAVIGDGPAYVAFQVVTTLILLLAANTGFNGAPRLAQILALDGYAPRQAAILGDRLAFSWGIVALAVVSAVLLWVFDGSVTDLIPLYSIGIFLSFSISQSGMVRHWLVDRVKGWQWRAGLNLVGAAVTAVVWVIITIAKLPRGAWIPLVAIPILVLAMEWIRARYRHQEAELHVDNGAPIAHLDRDQRVVVPVNGINRAVVRAVNVGRAVSRDIRAVYITDDPESGDDLRERWERQLPDVPIVVVESPYRALVGPLRAYLDVLDGTWPPDRPAPTTVVVLPEYVGRHWWDRVLYNQTTRRLRASIVDRDATVILEVPYRDSAADGGRARPGDQGDGRDDGPAADQVG